MALWHCGWNIELKSKVRVIEESFNMFSYKYIGVLFKD